MFRICLLWAASTEEASHVKSQITTSFEALFLFSQQLQDRLNKIIALRDFVFLNVGVLSQLFCNGVGPILVD